MRINVSGENLFANNLEKKNNPLKKESNVSSKEERAYPIKVTISEEGKRSYQNRLQKSEKNSYVSMMEDREDLIFKKNTIETNYSFLLGNKVAEIKTNNDKYFSFEEKAANLLEAYASAYDEIVQGYDCGTREKYVEDIICESGYRKLTKEEELDGLNEAYKKYASRLEAQIQQASNIGKTFEKYMAKLSDLDVQRAEMATQAQEVYFKINEDKVPENITEKMQDAKNQFIKQYSSKPNITSIGIKRILENIKVFTA